MNEQTRIRLGIIEARYGKRAGRAASETELAAERALRFDEEFRRAREAVVAPILGEIGAALSASGHGHRVAVDEAATQPSVELYLSPRGVPSGERSVIRLFARAGSEIIAEVELGRTVIELTRFHEASAMSAEVVEQMIVDAVEQLFAYRSSSA